MLFEYFLPVVAIVALVMLIWDCVEVGRNDAANIVNAVFGARVMDRKTAVYLAGIAVVLGASFASPVMETARKGIFDPALLTVQMAVVVYITAYIVDTALLSTYSAFGMPVSTTASLVFELVGASVAVYVATVGFAEGLSIVHWAKVRTVITAIIISIFLSGLAGWMMQRMFRGAMRKHAEEHHRVLLHGPWIAGLMFTWLSWFMLMKGMKAIPLVKNFRAEIIDTYGVPASLLVLWGLFTLIIHLVLVFMGEKGTRKLFSVTAVVGMICLGFAFGQNDLANCASPGLSSLYLWQNAEQGTGGATKIPIATWAMFGCGVLMVIGMASKNAQRVTRAAVNTGSQYDYVALYAPRWCRKFAKLFMHMPFQGEPSVKDLAPDPERTGEGKRIHFDTLRASVIMSVSSGVIAFASSKGLPVSTTYVTFAAVLSTGWADGTMVRGDADRKIGRAIWVIFSWFAGALLAMVSAAIVAFIIVKLGHIGLVTGIGLNLFLRFWVANHSEKHEKIHHSEASLKIQAMEEAAASDAAPPEAPPPADPPDEA